MLNKTNISQSVSMNNFLLLKYFFDQNFIVLVVFLQNWWPFSVAYCPKTKISWSELLKMQYDLEYVLLCFGSNFEKKLIMLILICCESKISKSLNSDIWIQNDFLNQQFSKIQLQRHCISGQLLFRSVLIKKIPNDLY